jgi:hypothetical protein
VRENVLRARPGSTVDLADDILRIRLS